MNKAGLILLVLLLGGAALLLYLAAIPQKSPETHTSGETTVQTSGAVGQTDPAPADPVETPVNDKNTDISQTTQRVASSEATDEAVMLAEREKFHQRFDFSLIGIEPMNDGDFNALVAYLKNDPELFAQFLIEYRENTDPDRAKRLAFIMGEFDDTTITSLAEELIFSGNADSQIAGLDLLGGEHNSNAQARQIISQVLQIEQNPQVLSSAMDALATPTQVDASEREQLLDQFVSRAADADPIVRSKSLSLMQRWAGEKNMNGHYISALQDENEQVRRSAMFGLMKTKHQTDEAYNALLSLVENPNESDRMRRNALLGLKKFNIAPEEEARLAAMIEAR